MNHQSNLIKILITWTRALNINQYLNPTQIQMPSHQNYQINPSYQDVSAQVYTEKVDDYLVYSILNLVFCFGIFSIIAVIFSCRARDSNLIGQKIAVREEAQKAKNYNIISFVIGIIIVICFIIVNLFFYDKIHNKEINYLKKVYYIIKRNHIKNYILVRNNCKIIV
jgi:heme/copper-type cytochrome/quinol oxidase subunit 2